MGSAVKCEPNCIDRTDSTKLLNHVKCRSGCMNWARDLEDGMKRTVDDLPKCIVTMEGENLIRCITSLDESEPPCTSLCSNNDTRPVLQELGVGNCKDPNLVSSPHSSRQGLLQYQYDLNSGFKSNGSHGDSVSQERDQIFLRIREKFTKKTADTKSISVRHIRQEVDEIPAYFRVNDDKNISNNTLVIDRKQLKTAHDWLIVVKDQNEEKLASGAYNNQISSHEIVRSGIESVTDHGICLREWLKPGCREVDKVESLLIFRQIVKMVDFAHSQGVVLQDLRPSCFILLPSNRVKYTGSSAMRKLRSATYHDSNNKRPLEQIAYAYVLDGKQLRHSESVKSLNHQPKGGNGIELCIAGPQTSAHSELQPHKPSSYQNTLIARQPKFTSVTAQLEEKCYTSPEEFDERGWTSFSSNIYGLGVLLFELMCSSESWEVHSAVMLNLCHRILPPNFLSKNPKEAGFCLWLLHPEPSCRPTTKEILRSEFICKSKELYSGEVFSKSIDNVDAESEQLLDFLNSLKEKKLKRASKLVEDIGCLEGDIKEVETKHSLGAVSLFSRENKEFLGARKPELFTSSEASSLSF
ncbi:hypothetical protein FNV43_RR18175 [Rhamnella rubrinervis]|uniref:Protein kinase domain-containing protein n=1 Tax=Rhamnella rubrinervis TaxID=2594499 RepID=A0A8K0EAR3_9ROSA|nr:hypothetical protein FNV43_RR18175 [Rhamnella rubrinervis]